jgi:hypothetical protein
LLSLQSVCKEWHCYIKANSLPLWKDIYLPKLPTLGFMYFPENPRVLFPIEEATIVDGESKIAVLKEAYRYRNACLIWHKEGEPQHLQPSKHKIKNLAYHDAPITAISRIDYTFRGDAACNSLLQIPCTDTLYSGDKKGVVCGWSVSDPYKLRLRLHHTSPVEAIGLVPTLGHLYVASSNDITLWQIGRTGATRRKVYKVGSHISTFSVREHHMVVLGKDDSDDYPVKIYDAYSSSCLSINACWATPQSVIHLGESSEIFILGTSSGLGVVDTRESYSCSHRLVEGSTISHLHGIRDNLFAGLMDSNFFLWDLRKMSPEGLKVFPTGLQECFLSVNGDGLSSTWSRITRGFNIRNIGSIIMNHRDSCTSSSVATESIATCTHMTGSKIFGGFVNHSIRVMSPTPVLERLIVDGGDEEVVPVTKKRRVVL